MDIPLCCSNHAHVLHVHSKSAGQARTDCLISATQASNATAQREEKRSPSWLC